LHDREVARLAVDAVCGEVLHPALNDGDAFLHKERHIAVVRLGEQLQRGAEHRLVLHDAAFHEVLHGGPPQEEFPQLFPYPGLLLDKGKDAAGAGGLGRVGRGQLEGIAVQLFAGGQEFQLQGFGPTNLKKCKMS
jgi:hypothetical protein